MVNRCSSNPGTNIGKPVFMNDPHILFTLMFKSLFYSNSTIFQMEWNEMINGQKTGAAVGGDGNDKLFVEMIGYSGWDQHWSYQQNKKSEIRDDD